jgi:hypothetical protein
MKEEGLKTLAVFVVIIAFFALLAQEMGWVGPQHVSAYSYQDYKSLENCEEIKHAYSDVLHRIWIDHPSYVEDVLTETDEFLRLDSLLEGNWDSVFEFCDTKDSIDYHTNWVYDPISTGKPDKPTPKAKHDKPMSHLKKISLQ